MHIFISTHYSKKNALCSKLQFYIQHKITLYIFLAAFPIFPLLKNFKQPTGNAGSRPGCCAIKPIRYTCDFTGNGGAINGTAFDDIAGAVDIRYADGKGELTIITVLKKIFSCDYGNSHRRASWNSRIPRPSNRCFDEHVCRRRLALPSRRCQGNPRTTQQATWPKVR